MEKLLALALSGPIVNGLYDSNLGAVPGDGPKFYFYLGSSNNRETRFYDPEIADANNPPFSFHTDNSGLLSTATYSASLIGRPIVHDGRITFMARVAYTSGPLTGIRIVLLSMPPANAMSRPLLVVDSWPETGMTSLTGVGPFVCESLISYKGKRYYSVEGGTGRPVEIFSFDGRDLVLVDNGYTPASATTGALLAGFNHAIYAIMFSPGGSGDGNNVIRRIPLGGGSPSNLTMPSTSFNPTSQVPQQPAASQTSIAEYKGFLYVAGHDVGNGVVIYRIDPNAVPPAGVSVANAPTSGALTSQPYVILGVFNDYLYYIYPGATGDPRIGRFDGTAWTDTHLDLTASDDDHYETIVPYRGNLALIGSRARVSAGTDTGTLGNYAYLEPSKATSLRITFPVVF